MIKIMIIVSLLNIFSENIEFNKLDMSKHSAEELKQYELIVFYASPYCCECMKSIQACVQKYNVSKIAFVVMPMAIDDKNPFMTYKFIQQDIKEKFDVSWEHIYFEVSEAGLFSKLGINAGGKAKYNETPSILLIKNNQDFTYYSYAELFSESGSNRVDTIFKSYYEK